VTQHVTTPAVSHEQVYVTLD